jgi:S-adenosylmethionine:tRNA ribosyltransferase-isomerase
MFSRSDYSYPLPADRIAQAPAAERTDSRLLHLDRRTGEVAHRRFGALPEILDESDLLVINDTAVVPARLMGRKETGGRAELLILDYTPTPPGADPVHRCLIRASKRPRPGSRLRFDEGLVAEVLEVDGGAGRVRFSGTADFDATLHRIGRVPLPPYIRRNGGGAPCDDRTAYQTVYAVRKGAVAAPTAGLHFTEALLRRLADRGVEIARITLHVGPGTFVPVRADDIRDHRMEAERFEVPEASAEAVNRARAEGRRVVAVGTTCVRTLEGTADDSGRVRAGAGTCDLFIYPGYRFRVVDAMITNFHLPESTLLMLVSAFAGRETILSAYRTAIEAGYRFYSYGDAMLIA